MTRLRTFHILEAGLAGFGCLVAAATLSFAGPAQTALNGKELFERPCGGCHALDRDKEGPRLRGVYGRVAGSVDSFQYSDALKKSGVRWTDETIESWLTDTNRLVPDNDMSFQVERKEERAAIIAFLKQNSAK